MRDQITVRLDRQYAILIAEMAREARISVNMAAAALLERALAEGWTVTAGRPQTSRPGLAPPPPAGPGPATNPPGR